MGRFVWHEFGLKHIDVNIENPIKHVDAIKDGINCAIRRFMFVSVAVPHPTARLLIMYGASLSCMTSTFACPSQITKMHCMVPLLSSI